MYFQQHHRDSKETSSHKTITADTVTRCNRRVLSLHRGSGSSHFHDRRFQGSEHRSLKHGWCQGGQRVCNLKMPRTWYTGDHDWHCKKLSIISFKQIPLSIKQKSNGPFFHLKVSGGQICMSQVLLPAADACGEAMLTSESKLPGGIWAFCSAKQEGESKGLRIHLSGHQRMLLHFPIKVCSRPSSTFSRCADRTHSEQKFFSKAKREQSLHILPTRQSLRCCKAGS